MKSTDYLLIDTQSLPDHRKIAIKQVGVKNLRYPVQIQDKHHVLQHTIATVLLTVDLPEQHKGTHMSRFIEVLHAHGSILHVKNIQDIPIQLKRRLQSYCAHVEFEFTFFLEKKAPVTQSRGFIDYTVRLSATLTGEALDCVLTVIVPVTTLCPCSKAISAQGAAHSQRGQVICSARFERPIWIEDLIRMVENSASCEVYSLLKRPDEKAVTEHAYTHPVFVEDLVRNIAISAEENPEITWYRIEAENFESIHNHNAYALIERGHINCLD